MSFLKNTILSLSDALSNGFFTNVQRPDDHTGAKVIINKIDVRPIQRQTQDVGKWRTALIMAEGSTQQRNVLYDLYADVLLDTHLESVIEKRIAKITNSKIVFQNKGKVNEDIEKLVKTEAFRNLLKETMNARFWGHSLIQLDFLPPKQLGRNKTELIPRKHVKPRFGIVVQNEWDLSGFSYLQPPYNDGSVIEVGERESLGKLLLVSPLVIYKRGGWGDWAEFVECFGMPIIDAAYNNEQSRDALQQAFDAMGSRGRLIRPEEAKVTIHTVNDNGTGGDLFNKFRQAINEEISISILGNTMTTTEAKNSGYAQSVTHAESQEEIHADDRALILTTLQEKVTPYLQKIGYNTEGGEWQFVDAERIGLQERLDMDLKLSEKIDIGKSYWYEKYNIPIPAESDIDEEDDGEEDTDEEEMPQKGIEKKKSKT